MPDILDRLAQERQRQDLEGVALAAKSNRWAETFRNIPPEEVLRSRVNLAETVNRTLENKMRLAAQSDVKALELLQKSKKMEEWERHAPLREELLTRRVESEGAHERFVQKKDAESMADVAGFFDTVAKIAARPGTPEYQAGLNAAIQRHPRIIGTQAGADALKNLQREHQDVAAITPPAGMEVDRIDIGDDGKAKAVFRPIPPASPVALPEGMVPSGATVNKRGDVSVNYSAPKSEKDTILPSLEKERTMHAKMLDRAKRIRARATDAAVIADADADILESEKDLADVESQIRTHREGKAPASAPAAPVSAPDAAGPVAIKDTPGKALAEIGRNSASPKNIERLKAAGFNVATTATGEAQLVFDKPVEFDSEDDLKASISLIPKGAEIVFQGRKFKKP